MTIKVLAEREVPAKRTRITVYEPVITRVDASRNHGPYMFGFIVQKPLAQAMETARSIELAFPSHVVEVQEV